MNYIIPPAISKMFPLQMFYKDGFRIKYATKFDIPLNK